MRKVCVFLLGMALVLSALVPAFSQDDMKQVPNKVFGNPTRPAAVFEHEAHNKKAKIDDCTACHHGGKDGKLDKKADSAGEPCVSCHPVKNAKTGVTTLRLAYHRQCIGCHEAKAKGPLVCAECHRKDGK